MIDYASLKVDIRNSREYKQRDRIDIQEYFIRCVSCLNDIFDSSIEMPVVFCGGDEVEGLFNTPEAAYLYFRLFNMLIAPVRVRAGIGVGEWNIKINSNNSTEQDGPVYHNAKYAMENADDILGYELLFFSGGKYDIFINAQINVSTLFVNKQSEYQNLLMLLSEIMYPIVSKNAYNPRKLNQLKEIIFMKNKLEYYTKWSESIMVRKHVFNEWKVRLEEPVNVDTISKNKNGFFESTGKVRGLATKLTEITDRARQTIEKSLKAGNVYAIRNACIVTLKMMESFRMGE